MEEVYRYRWPNIGVRTGKESKDCLLIAHADAKVDPDITELKALAIYQTFPSPTSLQNLSIGHILQSSLVNFSQAASP